ncbi:MAG: hypothetical protein KBC33_02335 [Candidatus Pacebacteria bacterium]|nr:hypothetical protein [Candidatus Paceibacterota bacterium]
MFKSNLKASGMVIVFLWVVMSTSIVFEASSVAEFVMGSLFLLILSCVAGIVLFIGLIVETPLYNWFKANEARHRHRDHPYK